MGVAVGDIVARAVGGAVGLTTATVGTLVGAEVGVLRPNRITGLPPSNA